MDRMLETLKGGLPGLGLSLSEDVCQRLCRFGKAVVEQNQVMNLTAITEPGEVARLHLLDSLSVLTVADLSGKTAIDVGCGAGFPGAPLAIVCPDAHFTLLDSLGKRMAWLEPTLTGLGVDAKFVTARAEEAVAACRETYDFALSRAVARLNILLELTAPYVKVGGAVIALKGAAAQEELREAARAIAVLGLQVETVREVPEVETGHTLIVLRKIAPTPQKYPRRYAKIKQSPLF